MTKWEYLEIRRGLLSGSRITCNQARKNSLASAIQFAFPESKLKVKDDAIETRVRHIDLMNLLGSEGWELVGGYGQEGSEKLLFKRPL